MAWGINSGGLAMTDALFSDGAPGLAATLWTAMPEGAGDATPSINYGFSSAS